MKQKDDDDRMRRSILAEKVYQMIRQKEHQMRSASLDPDTLAITDEVWESLIRNKPQALAAGTSEVQLEEDLLVIREILDDRRQDVLTGVDSELLRTMGPVFDKAVDRVFQEQSEREEHPSRLRAIDEALKRLFSNVDAALPFVECSEDDVYARKNFLRAYAQSLRELARAVN